MNFYFTVVAYGDCCGEGGVSRWDDGAAIDGEANFPKDDEESLSAQVQSQG